ncbi:hypothetical protein PTH_1087 [Pelotomaculum thermopropionicum SI]|uniref:Uncharacterized protein n=1 Tax=Pelotomaculum thermopropionicum (strain DSM 13744 / JCM 10971 / SI) TaxID=370438 RepID=A5D3A8_PELTS|nr:hypothetical protein PTH_1087 [Pelotomaculum thermopropionicum SI]
MKPYRNRWKIRKVPVIRQKSRTNFLCDICPHPV